MATSPTPRTARGAVAAALNLLPVMNLVTILIPLLLMSAQLVQIAVIDSSLPAISPITTPPPPQHDALVTPSLLISRQGVTIQGAEDVLTAEDARVPCASQPCQPDTYDYSGVQERLDRIKQAHPGAEVVILVPEDSIPYEVLVALMDAARERADASTLFPMVTISGGIAG